MQETSARPGWWGDHNLDAGRCGRWRVGPSSFWLARREHEWSFGAHELGPDTDDGIEYTEGGVTDLPDGDEDTRLRLGSRQTSGRIRLTPRLADRPLIVRPAHPIALPPRQELVLYFSSPLWLKVEVGDPLGEFLEEPMQRPSDTWFGPNTRTGELCYSLRTSARTVLADLPPRPHRAATEVHVINRADSMLPVDRVRVPVQNMTLFAGESGRLWTQVVTFERTRDDEHAELKLGRHAPEHARATVKVASPREAAPRGGLFHTFGSFIGGR